MPRTKILHELNAVHNGQVTATSGIESPPFTVAVTVEGVVPLLMNGWDIAAVEAKSKAKKNSAEKKTDNPESMVYRTQEGYLCITSDIIHACLVKAAKSKSDPRSPRKSAADLIKAVLLIEPNEIPFLPKTKEWNYLDRRRVRVQMAAITRTRPAMHAGWKVRFKVTALETSYIDSVFIHDLITSAGKFCGFCDHRPQYGRFQIIDFKEISN